MKRILETFPVPAQRFRKTDKGIAYTVTEEGNEYSSLYFYNGEKNILLEDNCIWKIDFYDDLAFAFLSDGSYKIINYCETENNGYTGG